MSKIPSLKEWRTATNAGKLSIRSKQLKALDTALENHWKMVDSELPTDLQPVREALSNWIGLKGPDWRKSERNAPPKRIVEQLYDSLDRSALSDKDREAFQWQDEQRKQRIALVFEGTQFVNRKAYFRYAEGDWRAVGDDFKRLGGWIKGQAKGKGKSLAGGAAVAGIDIAVANWLKATCDTENLDEASQMLMEISGVSAAEAITTFAECLPLIAVAASAIQMLNSAVQAARAAHRATKMKRKTGFILPGGDIVEAFEALRRLLQREAMNQATIAAIDAGSFGTRLALHGADGGIATNAAVTAGSMVAKIIAKIGRYMWAKKEAMAANEALRLGDLNSSLFGRFPLLGCYMLLMCDTFEIVNMVRTEQAQNGTVRFGTLAFKEEVQWIKRKHLDPVLAAAAECVANSPFLLLDKERRALFSKGARLMHKKYEGKVGQYPVPEAD
jgi:hypothetical protein